MVGGQDAAWFPRERLSSAESPETEAQRAEARQSALNTGGNLETPVWTALRRDLGAKGKDRNGGRVGGHPVQNSGFPVRGRGCIWKRLVPCGQGGGLSGGAVHRRQPGRPSGNGSRGGRRARMRGCGRTLGHLQGTLYHFYFSVTRRGR